MLTRRSLLAATLPAALASGVRAESPAPAAAAFAALPFLDLAALSPDGERVAARASADGTVVLLVHHLFDQAAKPQTFAVPPRMDIRWLRFLTNDIVLVGAGTQLGVEGQRIYVTRVYLWNWRTREARIAAPDLGGQLASDVVWAATDESPVFLLAGQASVYMGEDFWPSVHRVDAASGRSRRVVPGRLDVMGWTADAGGSVRIGWRTRDRVQVTTLLYRAGADEPFRTIDRADQKKREQLLSPVSIAPNTGAALLTADDDRGMTSLWSADLGSGEAARPVFVPDEGEIEEFVYDADAATLIGVRHGLARRTRWLVPELAELQAKFDAAVPASQAVIESLSRDRKRMLVRIGRADAAGGWYFFNVYDGALRRIGDVNRALRGVRLGPVSMERYKAADGMELTLKLTLPPAREPKALPAVVMPHGGPWSHDDMQYDYWSQFVASRGYAVLQPNFRGSTGHGTPYLRAGEGQLGLKMQDDLNDALRWAAARGIVDPSRAAIVGGSYGGYAAMWGLARDPAMWRCGISIAGVSALQRTVNAFRNSVFATSSRSAWERMTPDFETVSPINRVASITAPLLLIHGGRDLQVEDSESRRMAARMQAAGKRVEMLLLPLADHHFTREPDRIALLTAMEQFLLRHNPADAAQQA